MVAPSDWTRSPEGRAPTVAATGGWLIYHPRRDVSRLEGLTVYHDSFTGNQDPYVWNPQFLHSTCHMTQISSELGHINYWVSGETWPNFNHLYCDLVFVVQDKIYWADANRINADDPMVDSHAAFADHYERVAKEHPYERLRRYTLKADADRSFQPQYRDHSLIDIVPNLDALGYPLSELRIGLRAGFAAKPMVLTPEAARELYDSLEAAGDIRLTGRDLADAYRRRNNKGDKRTSY